MKNRLFLSAIYAVLIISVCASAIGVRNPNYTKKIKSIAILNFTGPGDLGTQATSAFSSAVKKLDVVVFIRHIRYAIF